MRYPASEKAEIIRLVEQLVRADSAEGVACKSLVSRVNSPALADHTALEILRPIPMDEVVPVVKKKCTCILEMTAHANRCVQGSRQPVNRL